MKHARRTGRAIGAILGATAAMVVGIGAARAQYDIHTTDWRQKDRADHEAKIQTDRPWFFFELRFGTWDPQVDSEFPNLPVNERPYRKVFGPGDQFYFGLEFDFQAFHIPYVGSIGPGLGWGFTERSAISKFGSCANCPLAGTPSGETTSLTIMPMYAVGVVRIDEPMHRWEVPIVPYVKFGFGMGFWTAGDSSGKTYKISPSGMSFGTQFAIGGMLSLNWVDQSAVARSREIGGARDFYAFGEFVDAALGLGGSEMRVGSTSWAVGLAVDF